MHKYVIIIALILEAIFINASTASELRQRKIVEEYAIIQNFLAIDSLGLLFENYHKMSLPPQKFGEAYIFAFINFYNHADLPEWYVHALRKLLLSRIDVLKSPEFSEKEIIEKMNQESKSFEETLKRYCSSEVYVFYSSMHSYIADFEERMPGFRSADIGVPCNSVNEYMVRFALCDKYYRELLIYFYKEQHNYAELEFLRKASYLSVADGNKNIVECITAFYKALHKERQRIKSNDIEPIFYLVIAAVSPSYHVPKKFLQEFRGYLLKLAENAMIYNSSNSTFLLNVKKINEEFEQILKKDFGILLNKINIMRDQ